MKSNFEQLKRITERYMQGQPAPDVKPAGFALNAKGVVVPATVRVEGPAGLYLARIVDGQIEIETSDEAFETAAMDVIAEDELAEKKAKAAKRAENKAKKAESND